MAHLKVKADTNAMNKRSFISQDIFLEIEQFATIVNLNNGVADRRLLCQTLLPWKWRKEHTVT